MHWHWPFARPEELAWAHATVRPDDRLVVSVIDRDAAPQAGVDGGVEVVRDLPDIDRNVAGARWLASRAATYRARSRVRATRWSDPALDLAHIHYVNRFTDAFLRTRPSTLVVSVHDLEPHVRRGPRWIDDRLTRRVYDRADALVVHHEHLRRGLVDRYGVAADRIHVVGHQVFPVAPSARAEQPTGAAPNVLFFGALRPNKGLEQLLTAFTLLPSSLDAELVIAGRGDAAVEATARAAAGPRVHVEIGHATTDRKAELFRDASIVVLPYTEFASQSGVLHDAYGHGRPVVVTDVGALGDTVREEHTGRVVAPGDPAALAEAMEHLLTDRSAWNDAAAAGRAVAAARAPGVVGADLRAVYDIARRR